MSSFSQRDIVLIPFPYSDLTGSKKRPALIISNTSVNKTKDRICCLVTSKRPKEGIAIGGLEKGELPFKSWVKPHRLFTIHEDIILKRLGSVNTRFHKNVVAVIHRFID